MSSSFSGRSLRSNMSNRTRQDVVDKIEDGVEEAISEGVAAHYQITKIRSFKISANNRNIIIIKGNTIKIIPPNMA